MSNPSIDIYKRFENSFKDRFRCNCLNRLISYKSLISINPRFHSICSSDFVTDRWLLLISKIEAYLSEDWRTRAYGQFNLLRELCQLANVTINDAIRQFHVESLIISNVLNENEFEKQINTTLDRFFQSTINSFISLIDIEHIFQQIDQYYMGLFMIEWGTKLDKNLLTNISINNQTNSSSLKVLLLNK